MDHASLDPHGPAIRNRYTELVGIEHPIVQEGMGPFNTTQLAAAVSNAGGLGTVSVPGTAGDLNLAAQEFRAAVEACAALTSRPFAVNIPVGHKKNGEISTYSRLYLDAVLAARRDDSHVASTLRVVTTSAGFPYDLSRELHDEGLIHQHKVGSSRHAVKAVEAGVDVVIAAGLEMGGHTPSSGMHTFVLVPNIADDVSVPVVLTGGVRDGRGLAAALALGADAVALGTRFAASTDNPDWHPNYSKALLNAREGDDVLIKGVYSPARILRNAASGILLEADPTRQPSSIEKIELMRKAQIEGDIDNGLVLTGQVASGIHELISVAEFVPNMAREAALILGSLTKSTVLK
ncbi:NAD(P)H-dependent flavin oxidoreductase [Arthrobacter globiformis]|uniref:NAD(P)H-dependent flavin oxidoreductase n=1 Tax=Arthrobacter globiformis TaxID=1665 RepID=UPI00278CAE90|nr:nitronate monooxygenase [Arthrobacter globiformis]MDQ0616661.1 NAD(P)H-dependent flavin oxidoreductase YrpB (nitropropane dioxygenase family) [Arthrobacter globiformis]